MITGHYLRHARGACLQGDTPRLLVHDARLPGTDEPAVIATDALSEDGDFVSLVRIRGIGHQNVAITPDRMTLILSEELNEGIYVVEGKITTLDPPTLEIGVYVAVPFVCVDDPANFYLWPHA